MQKTKIKSIQFKMNAKVALSLSLSLLTAFTPTISNALDLQIQRAINLRSGNTGEALQRVGRLEAGSIIRIPDEYAIRTNGNVDFERTLNNWLSRASQLNDGTGLRSFNGTKRDYFFPVQIVQAAPGSQVGSEGTFMIALRYLQRNGSLLVTSEAAPVFAETPATAAPTPQAVAEAQAAAQAAQAAADAARAAAQQPPAPVQTNLEAAAPCTNCDAPQAPLAIPQSADRLRVALDSHLNRPLNRMSTRTTPHVDTAISRFERTCGMRFTDFLSSLRQEIASSSLRTTVPNALTSTTMLGLMTQETTGDCRARGDGGRSVGLFQVQSTRYSRDALRNPVTNARAALDNLESKRQALASDFDFSRMTENDRLRILVSAYNGGERWVRRAKEDLQQFNRQQGASLDHNNWEHLRIFYFRRHLNSQNERELFGNVRGREQRSTKNALSNLAYTENLIPRPQASNELSLQEAWHRRIGS